MPMKFIKFKSTIKAYQIGIDPSKFAFINFSHKDITFFTKKLIAGHFIEYCDNPPDFTGETNRYVISTADAYDIIGQLNNYFKNNGWLVFDVLSGNKTALNPNHITNYTKGEHFVELFFGKHSITIKTKNGSLFEGGNINQYVSPDIFDAFCVGLQIN